MAKVDCRCYNLAYKTILMLGECMKKLASEIRYYFVVAVPGLLLVPLLLWGTDMLPGTPVADDSGRLLDVYRQFYGAVDEVATWLWLLSPYVLFLFIRQLMRYRRSQGNTEIGRAAAKGKLDLVESLVEAGADINAVDTTGQTPLHLAASNGNAGMVRMLLEDGAEPDLPDSSEGFSALHVAARAGDAHVADLLIRYGADLEARTRLQQTPLHLAAVNGHTEVTALLLKYHVRLDSRDADGMTALQLAEKCDHQDVCELIAHYADNSWPYLQISNG